MVFYGLIATDVDMEVLRPFDAFIGKSRGIVHLFYRSKDDQILLDRIPRTWIIASSPASGKGRRPLS